MGDADGRELLDALVELRSGEVLRRRRSSRSRRGRRPCTTSWSGRTSSTSSAISAIEALPGEKPSPSRPARRAAVLLWPPTITGIVPCTGLGRLMQFSKEKNSPSNVVLPPDHSARMTATYSSSRRPRSSNGTPSAANSSAQPSGTDAEHHAATGQVIERRQLLRGDHRVALRHDQDAGRQLDATRLGRHPREPDERIGEIELLRPARHLAAGVVRDTSTRSPTARRRARRSRCASNPPASAASATAWLPRVSSRGPCWRT